MHQLTHFPDGTLVGSSSASPDGKWIVIANKLDPTADDSDISIIAAAGGQAQPILSTKDWEGSPDWAPK